MTAAIMLLGPTRPWNEGSVRPRSAHVGAVPDVQWMATRREMAATIGSLGVPAVVMEDEPGEQGELLSQRFHRLIEQHDVGTFAVFWPLGARLNALSVEFGFLLERLRRSEIRPEAVDLLVERDASRWPPWDPVEGEYAPPAQAPSEPGNRALYYTDFARYGCSIRSWFDRGGLELVASAMVVSHRQRHHLSATT